MNRIFKIVFNRERGTSMVVNEKTSSVQVGKKAAIVVAVVGALTSGTALAAEDFVKNETVSSPFKIDAQNLTINSQKGNAFNIYGENASFQVHATQNVSLIAEKNGLQFQTEKDVQGVLNAEGDLKIGSGGIGVHVTNIAGVPNGGSLAINANSIEVSASGGFFNSSVGGKLDIAAKDTIAVNTDGRLNLSVGTDSTSHIKANKIVLQHTSTAGKGTDVNQRRVAVNALGKMHLDAVDSIEINAESRDGDGEAIYGVLGSGEKSDVKLNAKNILIETKSDTYARAVRAEKNSTLQLGNSDTESIFISAVGKGSDQASIGLHVRDPKSTMTVEGKNITIQSTVTGSGDAYGVIAQGAATNQNSKDYPVLNLNAANTTILASSGTLNGAAGIVAMSQGVVNSTGNIKVVADNAILTRGNSVININQSGQSTVQLDGNIAFDYDAGTSGTTIESEVNVNLNNANSYLNGNITRDDETPAEKSAVSGMKLALSNGGTWTSTADSFVNELTLDKGGIVNINLEDGKSHSVTVNTLKGESGIVNIEVAKDENLTHGSLVLDKDYARPADKPASDSTTSKVAVNLTGVTADDISADQLKKLSSDVIQKAEKTDFDLGHTTTVAEGDYNGAMTTETDKDGNVSDAKVATNTLMRDSLDLTSASVLSINRILMNDVRKRLGDLRSAEGTDGVWARYDGGKLSGDHGLENDFHTIQFGYDTALGAGYPRIGFAGSYTMGDAEYTRGDADMDAYSLAAYSTWMADNGMFADVIARVAKVDTDMTVDGTKKGSLDNFAASLSGEFGWRFNVTETFYVEPQAELTYTYIDSDSLALSNGSKYEFDAVDSLMGRAGFAAGFKCPQDKGDVYVRVSAVHEFLGDAAVTGGNGTVHEIDGKDTWVEYGIGANFNVNKNTYIYADVERTSGATLDEDWRANVGVRYSF